jgi:hypothetical protein
MAESVLVVQPLTAEMIEAGARLVEQLDANQFQFDAAFWYLPPDSGDWKIVLATPTIHSDGPRRAYRKIQKILLDSGESELKLAMIAVLDSTDYLVEALRKAVKTGVVIQRIRFTGNVVNSVYIPDALIYRMLPHST